MSLPMPGVLTDGGPRGVPVPLGRDEERACRLRPADASLRGSRGVGALSELMAISMMDDMMMEMLVVLVRREEC